METDNIRSGHRLYLIQHPPLFVACSDPETIEDLRREYGLGCQEHPLPLRIVDAGTTLEDFTRLLSGKKISIPVVLVKRNRRGDNFLNPDPFERIFYTNTPSFRKEIDGYLVSKTYGPKGEF